MTKQKAQLKFNKILDKLVNLEYAIKHKTKYVGKKYLTSLDFHSKTIQANWLKLKLDWYNTILAYYNAKDSVEYIDKQRSKFENHLINTMKENNTYDSNFLRDKFH